MAKMFARIEQAIVSSSGDKRYSSMLQPLPMAESTFLPAPLRYSVSSMTTG
jgi:hypothetical protein